MDKKHLLAAMLAEMTDEESYRLERTFDTDEEFFEHMQRVCALKRGDVVCFDKHGEKTKGVFIHWDEAYLTVIFRNNEKGMGRAALGPNGIYFD